MKDVPNDLCKLTPRTNRAFGNTLSYVNANGTGGAAQPAILKDTLLPSTKEITLLTDQPCDATCGYVQNGSVAYSKFFFFFFFFFG